MAYQDLIILCFYFISPSEKNCCFEALVAECFQRFPDKFSFKDHPDWPDARKLDRALRGMRNSGEIMGNPHDGFYLTRIGLKKAKELNKLFGQEKLF
jgi:hypothetical protein